MKSYNIKTSNEFARIYSRLVDQIADEIRKSSNGDLEVTYNKVKLSDVNALSESGDDFEEVWEEFQDQYCVNVTNGSEQYSVRFAWNDDEEINHLAVIVDNETIEAEFESTLTFNVPVGFAMMDLSDDDIEKIGELFSGLVSVNENTKIKKNKITESMENLFIANLSKNLHRLSFTAYSNDGLSFEAQLPSQIFKYLDFDDDFEGAYGGKLSVSEVKDFGQSKELTIDGFGEFDCYLNITKDDAFISIIPPYDGLNIEQILNWK